MRNRVFPLVAVMLAALLLSACGLPGSPAETAAPTPTAQPDTAALSVPESTPAVSYEQQRAILDNSRALWGGEDAYDDTWYYTYTDLDGNGRMEVLTVSTQGSGIFTYANVWEISPEYSGVSRCPDREDEAFAAWPELVVNTILYYTDPATGQRWYVCEDLTRDGAARYYNAWVAFSLYQGRIDFRVLASKSTEYISPEGDLAVAWQDDSGNPISEQDYDTAAARAFAGWIASTLSFEWTRVEFTRRGEMAAELPATYAGPAPQITKNPTSEALTIGGKTWFIAHADYADSLTWELVSPEGMIRTLAEAMNENPGLQLEALEGDTVAVSNVPLSVNGWSVRARFTGPGGMAVTEPAYLYVGDYLTAYASVIDSYRRLYANGAPELGAALALDLGDALDSSEHVGYAFKDLDKDGVPELIIAGIDRNAFAEGMLYGVFTLENGAPKRLAISYARDRWYLRTDSTLLNEGSSGAGYSSLSLCRLENGSLAETETAFTYYAGTAADGCYYRQGAYSFEPREGDHSITPEEYEAYRTGWESAVYIPPLTQIA